MSLISSFPSSNPENVTSLFRLLDDYHDHLSTKSPALLSARSFTPRFDVREDKEAYHLEGELPGVAQKDVNVEFTDPHTLVVNGSTQREHKEEEDKTAEGGSRFVTTERSFGSFHRSFHFPAPVNQENVKAKLKEGVLKVDVPKATKGGNKKITLE